MTFEELCSKFDSTLVVDNGKDLDKTYKSSSDKIYTDGEILDTVIDNNGNIVIKGLDNATYIAILDSNENIYLAVYEYISNPSIFEQIYSAYCELKKYKDNLLKSETKSKKEPNVQDTNIKTILPKDVYDISNFKCPLCKSVEQIIVEKDPKTNLVYIECRRCNVIFNMVPYTYYKLVSYTKPWKPQHDS